MFEYITSNLILLLDELHSLGIHGEGRLGFLGTPLQGIATLNKRHHSVQVVHCLLKPVHLCRGGGGGGGGILRYIYFFFLSKCRIKSRQHKPIEIIINITMASLYLPSQVTLFSQFKICVPMSMCLSCQARVVNTIHMSTVTL